MSEEEIIEIIEKLQCEYKEQENDKKYNDYTVYKAKEYSKGLQGLLDLYNKEKEKNNKWEQIYDEDQEHITNLNNTIFDLEAKNKKLDRENQGLFELYNFNDTSLLAKVLKDYKKEIKKKHI